MTQEDLAVLENFGTVWERVSGQHLERPREDAVTWEMLLGALEAYWRGCGRLSVLARGSHRSRLIRLAAEAREAFGLVQTECFLETGDVFCGGLVCDFASYTPYNLRKLCKNAVKLAGLLQKAKEEGCLPVGDAGKSITDHERVLKELLGECLR